MLRLPASLILLLTLMFILWPTRTRAQSKISPVATPGWGSVWTEPGNTQEHEIRTTVQQVRAAQKSGNSQAALALCNQQIQKAPDSVEPYVLRAAVYSQLQHYDAALHDVDCARLISQRNQYVDETAKLFVLAAALHERERDYAAAVTDLKASLKLDRDNPQALNSLAWLRATAPDGTVRNGREGVELAKRAVALESGGNLSAVTDTLAAAYAESNDYPRAVECEKRALSDSEKEIKDATRMKEFQKKASDRLKLFEQSHPYRAELP